MLPKKNPRTQNIAWAVKVSGSQTFEIFEHTIYIFFNDGRTRIRLMANFAMQEYSLKLQLPPLFS